MRLALFEPDIPQNLGAFIRLAACLGVPLDIIEPCGFPVDDKRIRRAAMDYYDLATITRHASWTAFRTAHLGGQPSGGASGRLVLISTAGAVPLPEVAFRADDILLLGRESAGVPADVHDAADLRVRIPLRPGARSLNVALAAAMVLSEGLRQTQGFAQLA
ncbi:MAG: tRNA (cytidine(34)-2'-O)-methyltransferase [Pseudomonadota bacterium]